MGYLTENKSSDIWKGSDVVIFFKHCYQKAVFFYLQEDRLHDIQGLGEESAVKRQNQDTNAADNLVQADKNGY